MIASKFDFLESLRGCEINSSDYRVLVTLLTFADRDGRNARPSVATLGASCAMHAKTVTAALRRLEHRGWVRLVRRGGGGGRGVGRVNVWELNIPSREDPLTARDTGGLNTAVPPDETGGLSVALPPQTTAFTPPNEDPLPPSATGGYQGITRVLRPGRETTPARARETPNLPAVPGNHTHPTGLDQLEVIDAEVVEEHPDPEPPEYCRLHMPYGTNDPCRACKTARINRERWGQRNAGRLLAQLAVQTQPPTKPAEPQYRCNWCHDGRVVLNRDDKCGSEPRVCHHDGTWHKATPDELAELGLEVTQ